MSNLRFNYDKKNDILYISIGAPKPSYGDELEEGIVIRKDFTTDEITGITIFDFRKRLENNDTHLEHLPLPERLKDYDVKTLLKIN